MLRHVRLVCIHVGLVAPLGLAKTHWPKAVLHKELQRYHNHSCGIFCMSLIEISIDKPEANKIVCTSKKLTGVL